MNLLDQYKEPVELKDIELLEQTKVLVGQERELSAFVLRHLEEVERRRLYAPKYSSLFEYCTLELKFSGSSAQRRIASVRLMKTVPQVEEMITTGALTMTHVAQAAQFFRIEEKNDHVLTPVEKLSILTSLENKSTREAERELAGLSSNPQALLNQDSIRPVTTTHSRISFVAEQSLLDDLEKVKALLSHRFPHLEMAELISQMAKIAITELEAKKFAQVEKPRKVLNPRQVVTPKDQVQSDSIERKYSSDTASAETRSRTVPAETKRATYKKWGLQCTFVDPITGRRCTSRHQIEYEHRVPFALGGDQSEENITLLCKTHNLWNAEQVFGNKVREYLGG